LHKALGKGSLQETNYCFFPWPNDYGDKFVSFFALPPSCFSWQMKSKQAEENVWRVSGAKIAGNLFEL